MVQRRRQLCLTSKPFECLAALLNQLGGQHLDGDVALERRIARLPDDPHPALADLLLEAVMRHDLPGA